ncbi:MAG: hypothetical protein K0S99_1902 [Thermomicrobiales bacterium]|jgi:hypothetical protein|nr:hypothetical protein [Thermomicrobiales bacterium]
MVPTAKRALSFEQIDAQTAVELPDRDMMALINIIVIDLVDLERVTVQVPVGVAVQVCGVNAAAILAAAEQGDVDCTQTGTVQELPVRYQ